MDILHYSFQLMAATLFLVVACGYLIIVPGNRLSRWFAFICLADVCLLLLMAVMHTPQLNLSRGIFAFPLVAGANMAIGTFMVWSWILIKDSKPFPLILGIAFAFQVIFESSGFFLREGGLCSNAGCFWEAYPIGDYLEILFALLAIYWIVSDTNSDLVQRRYALRRYVLAPACFVMLIVEFSPTFFEQTDSYKSQALVLETLVFFATGILAVILSLKTRFQYFSQLSPSEHGLCTGSDRKDVQQEEMHVGDYQRSREDEEVFNKIFIQQKLYCINGLTIAKLSSKLGIPQYRLRRLISERLGFRNFNSLLNHYRVQHVCDNLAEDAAKSDSITRIALSAGYNSLTTFNDAFRQLKGITPSQYRESMAKSIPKS